MPYSYAPSPSSRSSSPVYDLDSSPPSSPSQLPESDDAVTDFSSFNHPFAGSTRANHHKFRAYEKKTATVGLNATSTEGTTRFRSSQPEHEDADTLPGSGSEDDWDEAGDASFQSIETVTELSSTLNLPPHIARAKWDQLITEIVENPGPVNSIDLRWVISFGRVIYV